MTEFVSIERGLGPEGRIAVVRFDRRDALNALSAEAMRQLTAAARSFEDDEVSSVVVLTGTAKAFCAGADLKDHEARERGSKGIGALRRQLRLGPRLTRAWHEMEQVTIGAIEGFSSAAVRHWRWRWISASWVVAPTSASRGLD